MFPHSLKIILSYAKTALGPFNEPFGKPIFLSMGYHSGRTCSYVLRFPTQPVLQSKSNYTFSLSSSSISDLKFKEFKPQIPELFLKTAFYYQFWFYTGNDELITKSYEACHTLSSLEIYGGFFY